MQRFRIAVLFFYKGTGVLSVEDFTGFLCGRIGIRLSCDGLGFGVVFVVDDGTCDNEVDGLLDDVVGDDEPFTWSMASAFGGEYVEFEA